MADSRYPGGGAGGFGGSCGEGHGWRAHGYSRRAPRHTHRQPGQPWAAAAAAGDSNTGAGASVAVRRARSRRLRPRAMVALAGLAVGAVGTAARACEGPSSEDLAADDAGRSHTYPGGAPPKLGRRERRQFEAWLNDVRREAREAGVSARTVEAALKGLAPLPAVKELDRSQPEYTLTTREYLDRQAVYTLRLQNGLREGANVRPLLQELQDKYGVARAVIAAVWGVESAYGRIQGSYAVVPALVTLAYDSTSERRAAYFRRELVRALAILDRGHSPLRAFTGSWAGAMGQCQFMPSSFEAYAVDHDGDGKKDIWRSRPDALASIANYLEAHGWRAGECIGERVLVPQHLRGVELPDDERRAASQWHASGLRPLSSKEAPDGGAEAPLVLPAAMECNLLRPDGLNAEEGYLACRNFDVLKRYNASTLYAISVAELADGLESSDVLERVPL